jgi:diguanylate cyclase (GGDEF)-like protein
MHAAAHEGRKVGVGVLDVERLKTINDSLGRQAGDELLRQIAQRFGVYALDERNLGRLDSDHFAVMVPGLKTAESAARLTRQRLKDCFGPVYRIDGNDLRVSARLGIALYPDDGDDAETLLKHAEAALKNAKASGEKYLFYTQQMTELVAGKLTLENKLRQALENGEFVLHYQAKVDTVTQCINGVEALIRWQSPELGLVPPGKFIPLMEETGLILEVGNWALARAVEDHRGWLAAGLPAPRISVNVSAIQMRSKDFVDVIAAAIGRGARPPGIDLEITESLVMEDIEASIGKLKQVRGFGLEVAIDDFGTGYSSLAYLARLPVQTLKIDRSFIITMLDDPGTMTLVQTMISLAHSLHLKVVAEGVDQVEQAKVLRLIRCDQMQGYLFSQPVPAEDFARLLEAGKPLG